MTPAMLAGAVLSSRRKAGRAEQAESVEHAEPAEYAKLAAYATFVAHGELAGTVRRMAATSPRGKYPI